MNSTPPNKKSDVTIVIPGLSEAIQAINNQHQETIRRASEAITPAIKEMLNLDLSLPKAVLTSLNLDYHTLFPDLSAITAGIAKINLPDFNKIFEVQRKQFAASFERIESAWQASLPPNWRGKDIPLPRDLEVLLLDEGLPLAWVPPKDVLVRIFNATDARARRKVIGGSWRKISNTCIGELDAVDAKELNEYTHFARKAAEALLAGQHESSQALSANVLDTILRREFDNTDRTTITGRPARLNINDYPVRVAIVLGGIWGAHAQFWPQQGDKIPRNYTRHGTAHGVSRRQYSRINAVLALMHTVSLIRLMQTDLHEAI